VLAPVSVLAVLGVLFKRINTLFSSMSEPLVDLATGLRGGRAGQPFDVAEVYLPTWVEWGVLLGMVAFFCTLVTLGVHHVVIPGHRSDAEDG